MFSTKEKQEIAAVVEQAILAVEHPEMPKDRPTFTLRVEGKEGWSWAEIKPNWTFDGTAPRANPWNEQTHEEIAANAPKITEALKSKRKKTA